MASYRICVGNGSFSLVQAVALAEEGHLAPCAGVYTLTALVSCLSFQLALSLVWPWGGVAIIGLSIAFLSLWLLVGLSHWGEPKRGQNGVGSPGYFSRTGVVALLGPRVAGPVK